jgi:hypothetical protein
VTKDDKINLALAIFVLAGFILASVYFGGSMP